MKYKCDYCNYETHDLSHYGRHKKSKKHLNNEEAIGSQVSQKYHTSITEVSQKYECNHCNKFFSAKCNLYRHIKHYCKKISNSDLEIVKNKNIQLEEQNKKLLDTIENQSKIVASNSEITKNTTEIAKSNSNMAKRSMNVLSYALNNFTDAPAVGLLENEKFENMAKCLVYDNKGNKKTNKLVEEIIIYHHRKGTLVKVLGELIVNEYKKKNPKKQSIWTRQISS